MRLTKKGIDLLHHFEGCKLKAYLCPAKVWTIGWGNTRYEDGTPVKEGDEITQERADKLFLNIVDTFAEGVRKRLLQPIGENRFNALVSFAYNVGLTNFGRSTLLKKINANPDDETIRDEFMKWNRGGGVVLSVLTRRRKAEADLYFEKD
jgi:lysozyme